MEKKFVITFAGDTSIGDWYIKNAGNKELLLRLENNPESFFEGINAIINNSDYLILNLESVFADNPKICFLDKKYPNWDKPERLLKILRNLGVTAVNLANNHTMDFGPDLLLETKKLLEENNIKPIGAGKNIEEARHPYKITLVGEKSLRNIYMLGGMNTSKRYKEKYNFFASNDMPGINPLNSENIRESIKKLRSEDPNSFIIVFPHWQGVDYQYAFENSNIHSICSEIFECGANYIIGHGSHMLDRIEKSQSGAIAYSIGNFVFNSRGRYEKLNVLPISTIARLQFEENESDWSVESRFYPIVTDNIKTNYQTRATNKYEFENLMLPMDFSRGEDSHGFYFSTNTYESGLFLPLQNQNTDDFNIKNILLNKPNEYKNEIFSTSNLLASEFQKKGYSSTRIGKYLVVNLGKENVVFLETESSFTSLVGARIVKEKPITRKFLKIAGLNVMEGKSFSIKEKENALNYALSLPASVIKPSDGNKGKGVTVGVKNKEEFEDAWNNAVSVTGNKILLEEQFIGGTEARYLVVNGICVAVFACFPPNIIGNGIDTIEKLISQKNKIRLKNPHLKSRLIKINNHRISIINNQGYTLSSIPDDGVMVMLDLKSSVATGGDSIDITDETHILYKKLAEKAVNSIPCLDIAGVDIIAHNHFQEPQENSYTILEINTRPGIGGHHYPLYGKSRNAAGFIAEYCINRVKRKE